MKVRKDWDPRKAVSSLDRAITALTALRAEGWTHFAAGSRWTLSREATEEDLVRRAEMLDAPERLLAAYMAAVPKSDTVLAEVGTYGDDVIYTYARLKRGEYTFSMVTVGHHPNGYFTLGGASQRYETPEALDTALGLVFDAWDFGKLVKRMEAL